MNNAVRVFQYDRYPNKGAMQHASTTTLNKLAQNLKKKYQKLCLFKRTDQYSGQKIPCFGQYQVDFASEDLVCRIDRLNFIYIKKTDFACKMRSFEHDAVINPPLVISFTT